MDKQKRNFGPVGFAIAGSIALVITVYSVSVITHRKTVVSTNEHDTALEPFTSEAKNGVINESGPDGNDHPYLWLNSGGLFYVGNGRAKTVQGSLSRFNYWRLVYSLSNPLDTDGGYHPQNVLRLITKASWQNYEQEAYIMINRYNTSNSPNRAAHNGFLFLERYQDSDNLYYAGIRVDGNAVIKKKVKGTYYTLGIFPAFPGAYNRETTPSLLPTHKWVGVNWSEKHDYWQR
ncbi:hypothetical protein KW783_02020 [Candidatus Parcubacteria bacterium]|nr:hypothetical protein [Candidatus Parcubacteria bacterium]